MADPCPSYADYLSQREAILVQVRRLQTWQVEQATVYNVPFEQL